MPIPVDNLPDLQTVPYAEVRSNIRSGDILLCAGNVLFSKMIQHATKSIWSHVAFIVRFEALDRVMVLESVETIGVRTVPLSSYVNDYNGSGGGYPGSILIARHKNFNPSEVLSLSKHAVNLFGYPYDTQEIMRIAARIMMPDFAPAQKAPDYSHDRSFICSEYAYECFRSVGIEVDYNPRGFVAPADFARTPEINPVALLQSKPSTVSTTF
jgi:hypothetical protein